MTASLAQPRPARQGPSPVVALVVGGLAVITVFALMVAGLTFIGLAIAFPIAVPVAQSSHVAISPIDAALAQQFAGLWWAFAALAVVSFGAAALVTVKVADLLSRPSAD
jgi:hypothetical protein